MGLVETKLAIIPGAGKAFVIFTFLRFYVVYKLEHAHSFSIHCCKDSYFFCIFFNIEVFCITSFLLLKGFCKTRIRNVVEHESCPSFLTILTPELCCFSLLAVYHCGITQFMFCTNIFLLYGVASTYQSLFALLHRYYDLL